jgi:hypothetical protein
VKSERWKNVAGYEGLYEVSDLGRVRSLHMSPRWGREPRILRPQMSGNGYKEGNGYLFLVLCGRGPKKAYYVHDLVAKAFIGPKKRGREVNHEDGDKTNCAATNLNYKTRLGNIRHALRTGLAKMPPHVPGEKNGRAILTESQARTILSFARRGMCGKEIATRVKTTLSRVQNVTSRKCWRHLP